MAKKVAINGFGRIGRNTLRAAIKEGIFEQIDYVAINDPGLKPEDAARIFKYDSVMGQFCGTVEAYEEGIIVNGKKIKFFAEKDPANLPWKDLGVEVAVLKAIHSVETSGASYLASGYPALLFEAHVFYRELKKKGKNPDSLMKSHPRILSKSWNRKL